MRNLPDELVIKQITMPWLLLETYMDATGIDDWEVALTAVMCIGLLHNDKVDRITILPS